MGEYIDALKYAEALAIKAADAKAEAAANPGDAEKKYAAMLADENWQMAIADAEYLGA